MSEYMSIITELRKLKDGEPCSHPGCLSHITHPCERCGRFSVVSRLQQLTARINIAKETLEFYADSSNYNKYIDMDYQFTGEVNVSESNIDLDGGNRAISSLKDMEDELPEL